MIDLLLQHKGEEEIPLFKEKFTAIRKKNKERKCITKEKQHQHIFDYSKRHYELHKQLLKKSIKNLNSEDGFFEFHPTVLTGK
jgi:hypothetical protein